MQIVAAPPDAAELIAALPELGNPTGEQLQRLLASIDWLQVPVGSRLFTEGESVDGVYILFAGRVRFVVESAATPLIPWEVNPVAIFGEGALLTGEGRSRTAVAVRDSLVARIPPAMFEAVMTASSEVAVAMARRIARRTVFPGVDERTVRRTEDTISFVSNSVPTGRLEPFREAAAAALGESGQVVAFGSDRVTEAFDAVRHSDRVVVVVDATNRVDVRPLMDDGLQGIDQLAAPLLELIVIDTHDGSDGYADRWRPPAGFSNRLRVREGDAADLRRIGRHVSGRSVGLVLGGGGARGLAHIGVLRALAELDIPVDAVGGSSMGAIIGGEAAQGWPWNRVLRPQPEGWRDARLRLEITFPTVSLLSGRRSRKMFDESFGEHGIEDFRLPFFCTSVDLSTLPARGPPGRASGSVDLRQCQRTGIVAAGGGRRRASPHRRRSIEQRADERDARVARGPDHRRRRVRPPGGDDRQPRFATPDRSAAHVQPPIGSIPEHRRDLQPLRAARKPATSRGRP